MQASTHSATDVAQLRRALTLGALGPVHDPNPQVGCVIVGRSGGILAEGWHRGAGTPHAEVDALSRLAEGAGRGATVYVTLEPCNHHGRTGPCATALIDAGVARVVYSVTDPGSRSAGGAQRLRAAGIEVDSGVLLGEGETLLGDWLISARLARPVVTVKWAASLDGRAAAADGTSQWITGREARADVHARRARSSAIAVGTGTLLADDPALTARDGNGLRHDSQPAPVVFGRREIPVGAAVLRHPLALRRYEGRDLAADLADLHGNGIRSLFVEGGPTLASAFISAGLADELLVYLAPALLGGPNLALGDLGVGTIADARRFELADVTRLGDDVRLRLHPRTLAAHDAARKD